MSIRDITSPHLTSGGMYRAVPVSVTAAEGQGRQVSWEVDGGRIARGVTKISGMKAPVGSVGVCVRGVRKDNRTGQVLQLG